MALRIAFVGAGSVVFTRRLIGDILSMPALRGSTIVLHDIDPVRLDAAEAMARYAVREFGGAATVEACPERRAALEDADVVLNMIQVGGHPATLVDFDVPRRFGVTQTIADTSGVGGVFRALRTIPVMWGIAEDMLELCPRAWLLNYTNPMAMNCMATYLGTSLVNVVGLCHSVQDTSRKLAELVGVPFEEATFLGAGINHQAWVLRFERDGEDLYPRLRERVEADPELRRRVRVELFRRLGYFPTESSEHSAEYVPWFLDRPDLVERFRIPIDEYVRRSERNLVTFDETADTLRQGADLAPFERSHEYAADIINSMVTGEPSVVYGNVRNTGLITNLPEDLCVEVPCLVDRAGVQPTRVGDLPPQLAALNRTYGNVVELTARAAVTGDRNHVYHALMLDPRLSRLSLDEIWTLGEAMFDAHGDALPEALRESPAPAAA
jgi:alpha-galactosidase